MQRLGINYKNNDFAEVFKVVGQFFLHALLDSETKDKLTKAEICMQVKALLPIAFNLMYGGNIRPYLKQAQSALMEENIYFDNELDVFQKRQNGKLWENSELLIIFIDAVNPLAAIF